MKKILFALTFLITLFSGCNSEDEAVTNDDLLNKFEKIRFYGVKTNDEIELRGITQKDKLWYNGTTILIKFLNDPYNLKEKIKEYASEWSNYANINFQFIDTGDAHVRIGFDWNNDRYITWSYIGTDCKAVTNQAEATLSFADARYLTDDELRGDVLRAFGQVLGLELEHRHLDFNPEWRRDVERYWTNEILDIDWDILSKYVFDPLNSSINVEQTGEYDEHSIMVWPFPKSYLINSDGNLQLSEKDIEFIKKLYPKDISIENEVVLTMTTALSYVNFDMASDDDVVIDWGDGYEEVITSSSNEKRISHSYNSSENKIISIIGKKSSLKYISVDYNSITQFDASKCTELTYLSVSYNKLVSLDISNNTKLWALGFASNNISVIDVSKCPDVTHISAESTNLSEIDVSQNKKLLYLAFKHSKISSLDISQNPEIRTIICIDTPLAGNVTNFVNLANDLPSRIGKTVGKIDYMGINTPAYDIIRNKNWINY